MSTRHRLPLLSVILVWMGSVSMLSAQWLTQSFDLKQGWNAVYLHVDASHDTMFNLLGAGAVVETPIEEVWMWIPNATSAQFIDSPQEPVGTGSQWVSWKKSESLGTDTLRLSGNLACLVYATNTFTWKIKGRPVPFRFQWTSTGLNLVGFPTPTNNPPSFANFLTPAPGLLQSTEIYHYWGGELGATNPARLFSHNTFPVRRGEAFWVRSADAYNRYFGPFEITLGNVSGIEFGDDRGQTRLRLRNVTSSARTVSLRLLASEAPPVGQTPIAATPPPLLLRGPLNITNLTYSYTNLTGSAVQTFELAAAGQPGSEIEVVVGLNRSLMAGPEGTEFAGILRFTDSLNLSQRDVPVSARVASSAGLWVGAATVTQVRSYLKNYQKDTAGGNVVGGNNAYVVTGLNTNLGAVPHGFPLRLILHADTNQQAHLLQRAYFGPGPGTNYINATRQSFLDPSRLEAARRISAVHLPASPTNTIWACTGSLQSGGTLTATVTVGHGDQASNPFLHTYHPDHDNLRPDFKTIQPQGFESYGVTRVIKLTLTPPTDDFASIASAGQSFSGIYDETVTFAGKQSGQGSESRTFASQGYFILNRLNRIGTLTTQ